MTLDMASLTPELTHVGRSWLWAPSTLLSIWTGHERWPQCTHQRVPWRPAENGLQNTPVKCQRPGSRLAIGGRSQASRVLWSAVENDCHYCWLVDTQITLTPTIRCDREKGSDWPFKYGRALVLLFWRRMNTPRPPANGFQLEKGRGEEVKNICNHCWGFYELKQKRRRLKGSNQIICKSRECSE